MLRNYNWRQLLKKSVLHLFVLLICFLLPTQISKGCGPYDNVPYGYTFINKYLLAQAAKPAPFLLDLRFEGIYQYFGTEEFRQEEANIEEWRSRVCEAAKPEDIRYVVYGTDMNELFLLQSAARDPNASLPSTMRNNEFVDYLLGLDCKETIDYLVFAKRCEPHVISYADMWEQPERNVDAMEILIEEGRRQFKRTKSHYIRLRYAFQVVRLAHYLKDYEYTLDLYDFFMPKIDDKNSLIYYWILGHRAGALRALGQNVESSYLYTQIFSKCPNRRQSAFRSFLIRTDAEWEACYLMCKDDDERAAMYAIRAGNAKGRLLLEMQNIYGVNPKSDFLEMLLLKEVRNLEESFLGYPANGRLRHQRIAQLIPKDAQGQYLIDLQEFARRCRLEGKVKNKTLWQIAEGYLEFLAGDFYKATKTLDEVQRDVVNEDLKDQLQIFSAVLNLASIEEMDGEVEDELLDISRDKDLISRYPDFQEYFYDRVAELYLKAGRPGLAFRAHYSLTDLRYNPDLRIIDDLLATFDETAERTRFEVILGRDTLGESAKLELLDMKATYYMARGKLREANVIWKGMDRAEWKRFGAFNPFVERIRDCVNCDNDNGRGFIVDTVDSYSKGLIVEMLLNTDRDSRLGDEDAPRLLYNMGLALYNMSYFGHEWAAMDHFRSGSSYSSWNLKAKNGVIQHPAAPFGNKENFNVSGARNYFEEAYELAFAKEQYELAAKAAFMAAKCEQKQYFTSGLYKSRGYNQILVLPEEYTTNYKALRGLAGTDFYRFIVEECKYFGAYVR
ncbi:MAG: hypothetical protein AAGG68_15595 [Bacteroidota bacterium]